MTSWADVRVQAVIVGVIVLAAMVAVPLFYSHRMNAGVWSGGMIAFVGVPTLAGILQKQANRPITLAAAILLLLCPLVYAATDPLAVEFERLRDGYFLVTGATVIFASAVWVACSFRLREWAAMFAAMSGLVSAMVAVCVMLWMLMYFE